MRTFYILCAIVALFGDFGGKIFYFYKIYNVTVLQFVIFDILKSFCVKFQDLKFGKVPPILMIIVFFLITEARIFKDVATGKCLDSNSAERVYTLNCNGGNYQNWEWNSDQTIRNVATGKCLDSNGDTTYTKGCNGGAYQKWLGSNSLEVKNLATGHCLDSNVNGQVYPKTCNGGSYQKWTSN